MCKNNFLLEFQLGEMFCFKQIIFTCSAFQTLRIAPTRTFAWFYISLSPVTQKKLSSPITKWGNYFSAFWKFLTFSVLRYISWFSVPFFTKHYLKILFSDSLKIISSDVGCPPPLDWLYVGHNVFKSVR